MTLTNHGSLTMLQAAVKAEHEMVLKTARELFSRTVGFPIGTTVATMDAVLQGMVDRYVYGGEDIDAIIRQWDKVKWEVKP